MGESCPNGYTLAEMCINSASITQVDLLTKLIVDSNLFILPLIVFGIAGCWVRCKFKLCGSEHYDSLTCYSMHLF